MTVKPIKKIEIKRHEFRFPNSSLSQLIDSIIVTYESKKEFLAKSRPENMVKKKGDYNSFEEILTIQYRFLNSREISAAFKVKNYEYSTIRNAFGGRLKHIHNDVYLLLQFNLPRYASRILPDSDVNLKSTKF